MIFLSAEPAAQRDRALRPPSLGTALILHIAVIAPAIALSLVAARAVQPETVNGVPQQVIPTYQETGAPNFTFTPGQATDPIGSGGTGAGAGDGSGDSGDGALGTMMGQSWGNTAALNAQALGVNPTALAATCVLESGCENVGGKGTVAGAFQMTGATYTSSLNAALTQDPALASGITQGLAGQMDPATESIAASEYLYQGAQTLQSGGIQDPTVLDVRGYYNFGPSGGIALANATDNQTMASVLNNFSPATLAANGIQPGETVGQWRAGVSAKIGTAANQPVLSG